MNIIVPVKLVPDLVEELPLRRPFAGNVELECGREGSVGLDLAHTEITIMQDNGNRLRERGPNRVKHAASKQH